MPPDPALVEAIAALPGRKLVFTNGTADYAERVIARIGLTGQFLAIHDIIACDYLPKPDPSGYARLIAPHAIAPRTALMVEDMARNLRAGGRAGHDHRLGPDAQGLGARGRSTGRHPPCRGRARAWLSAAITGPGSG